MSVTLRMNLGKDSYDILVERGALSRVGDILDLNRRVLILTDDGVPSDYAETVADACKQPVIVTVPQGENSKCAEALTDIWSVMLEHGFTRSDCVVAVGGGVVGDLAGFAAATFMRGIDFYNIPTTLLSQVDSSIGGKTAINHGGIKNCVGAFYQPVAVVIDPDVLVTLDKRQLTSGLAESVKMAATSDADLFARMEEGVYYTQWDKNDPEKIESFADLEKFLLQCNEENDEMYVALYADETVPYGEVVKVLNIANDNNFKMVLATRQPVKK